MMVDLPDFPHTPGDTRTGEKRTAVSERFSDDPSRGVVVFNPDGSFDWPRNWSLGQKLRTIDLSRRGGDPTAPAAPLGDDDLLDRMVERLREELGDEADTKIEAMRQENDAKLTGVLAWEAKQKVVMSQIKAPLYHQTPFATAWYRQRNVTRRVKEHGGATHDRKMEFFPELVTA